MSYQLDTGTLKLTAGESVVTEKDIRIIGAGHERAVLLANAAARHVSDLRDAARRYESEISAIESIYSDRVHAAGGSL